MHKGKTTEYRLVTSDMVYLSGACDANIITSHCSFTNIWPVSRGQFQTLIKYKRALLQLAKTQESPKTILCSQKNAFEKLQFCLKKNISFQQRYLSSSLQTFLYTNLIFVFCFSREEEKLLHSRRSSSAHKASQYEHIIRLSTPKRRSISSQENR